jgi:hypothetical protein
VPTINSEKPLCKVLLFSCEIKKKTSMGNDKFIAKS